MNTYNMFPYGVIIHLPQQANALMNFCNGSIGDEKKECNITFHLVDLIKE